MIVDRCEKVYMVFAWSLEVGFAIYPDVAASLAYSRSLVVDSSSIRNILLSITSHSSAQRYLSLSRLSRPSPTASCASA